MSDPELNLLTKILRARISTKAILDCHILDRATFLAVKEINQHIGTYIGFFTRRPKGNICFFLFVRPTPTDHFRYVFGYYVNVKFFKIPKSELDQFKIRLTPDMKQSVQMVQTDANPVFYPSVLMQMIVFTVNKTLVDDFKRYRLLKSGGGDLFYCFNASIGYPTCTPGEFGEDALSILTNIETRGFIVDYLNCSKPTVLSPKVDLVIVGYNGHLTFGIHYKASKVLNIILPHVVQFAHATDVKRIKSAVEHAFRGYKFNEIVASRLYSTSNEPCNGPLVFKACALALHHPFVTIRDSELRAIILESSLDQPLQINIADLSPFSSQSVTLDPDHSQQKDISQIEKVISKKLDYDQISMNCGDDEPPEVPAGSQAVSSQATVIISTEELDAHLALITRRREHRPYLAEPFLTCGRVSPATDPNGWYLDSEHMFWRQLEGIIDTMEVFTTARVFRPTKRRNVSEIVAKTDESDHRFILLPVLRGNNLAETDAPIVVDRDNEEWGFMCPDNLAWRHQENFQDIKAIIEGGISLLSKYEGRVINMTSYFHTGFPRIHLLMAMFQLSKLFRYASVLPRKVIYREKDFRGYCQYLCHQLSIKNAIYNFENGLIKSNLFLAKGAFVSHVSPVQFERAVVNEDQCPFCCVRNMKNLGSHMAMAHGGFGKRNREARRWRESVRS